MGSKIVSIIFLILIHFTSLSFAGNSEDQLDLKKRKIDIEPISFGSLPQDVQIKIHRFLTTDDLGRIAQVSNSWNNNLKQLNTMGQVEFNEQGQSTYNLHYETGKKIFLENLNFKRECDKKSENNSIKLFFEAIENRNLSLVRLLHKQFQFDLNKIKDSESHTPLTKASLIGDQAIISFLLQNGAGFSTSTQLENKYITDSFLTAITAGHTKIVKFYLTDQANFIHLLPTPDVTQHTASPLFAAASHDRPEIVKLILDTQSDTRVFFENQDNSVSTPLFVSASSGYNEVMEMLLNAGAPINHFLKIGELKKKTSLESAAINGHLETVKILLKRGARVNLFQEKDLFLLNYIFKKKYWDIFECLLDAHKNLYHPTPNHVDPLASFLLSAAKSNQMRIIDYLSKYGVDINILYPDSSTQKKQNLLFFVTKNGNVDAVKFFLDKSLSENLEQFRDAIYIASEKGFEDIFHLLLEAGKKTKTVTEYASLLVEALQGATSGNFIEIVKFTLNELNHLEPLIKENFLNEIDSVFFELLEDGNLNIIKAFVDADPSFIDKNLYDISNEYPEKNIFVSPLYIVSKLGHIRVVKFLLEHKVNLNIGLTGKWNLGIKEHSLSITPLYVCSELGYHKISKILLEAGALPYLGFEYNEFLQNQEKSEKNTPLYIASKNNHYKTVELYIEMNIDLNLGKHLTGEGNSSPLSIATHRDYIEIAHILEQAGAKNILYDQEQK